MSEGIVGIVASRIKDYCNKPLVLTKKVMFLKVQRDQRPILILVNTLIMP